MIIDISATEESLLEQIGVPWNGWQYEHEAFLETNSELEANGISVWQSFKDYLEARVEYRKKIAETQRGD